MKELRTSIANFGDKLLTKHTYAICNEFGLVAIAYADYEGDALDAAVDAGLMEGHIIELSFLTDLPEEVVFAGNYGRPVNTDYLRIEAIKDRR